MSNCNCGHNSPAYLTTYYPSKCGCKSDNCHSCCECCYTGPNLPNSGINKGDCFDVVLQKLDNELNVTTLAQEILYVISTNTALLEALCALIGACPTTTTTTSTTTSTTSTTTTFPPV